MAPSIFYVAKTMVFWDVEECRIPTTENPDSIHGNIKSALQNEGYTGKMNICAYSDGNQKAEEFEKAGIKLVPTGDKNKRYNMILVDIHRWMFDNPPCKNVMLICPDISHDPAYFHAVCFMKRYGYNVLLSHHKDVSEVLAFTVETVWLWENLLAGGKPIDRIRSSSLPDIESESSSLPGIESESSSLPDRSESNKGKGKGKGKKGKGKKGKGKKGKGEY